MKQLLAVYGTLKQGYGNHVYIREAQLPFIGNMVTKDPAFFMYGGGFPIVTDDVHEHQISVEVYEFEDEQQITGIDRLEGHPRWYRRKQFTFVDAVGNEHTAWMYVMRDGEHGRAAAHPSVTIQDNVATWGRYA